MLMNNDPFFTPQPPQTPIKTYHPKRVAVILSIVAAVIVLVAGVVIYMAVQPKKQTTAPVAVVQDDSLREALNAEEVIARINKTLQWTDSATTPLSIPIKVTGYSFYTVVSDTSFMQSRTATLTSTTAENDAGTIQTFLEDNQFKKTVAQENSADNSYVANFSRSDVVCQLTNVPKSTDTTDADKRLIEIKCLDTSRYETLAKEQAVLYNAYSPASSVSYEIGLIGSSTIHDSKLAGYKLAEIAIGEISSQRITALGTAMFYQSSDGLWHYFQTRQNDMLSCDLYKSPSTLRTIYEGEPCRDAKKGITVVEKPKGV